MKMFIRALFDDVFPGIVVTVKVLFAFASAAVLALPLFAAVSALCAGILTTTTQLVLVLSYLLISMCILIVRLTTAIRRKMSLEDQYDINTYEEVIGAAVSEVAITSLWPVGVIMTVGVGLCWLLYWPFHELYEWSHK